MFKYYLLESAFSQIGMNQLQSNLMELNSAMVEYTSPLDDYYYSEGIWTVQIANKMELSQCIFCLPNQKFCRVVLPILLRKLHIVGQIQNFAGLCTSFPNDHQAFWGESFNPKNSYDLWTKTELETFRFDTAKNSVCATNLSAYKAVLFKRLVLCDSAFDNLGSYSKTEFDQIINRLLELDRFNQTWTNGTFVPSRVTLSSSLKVSYESQSTNNDSKKSALRWFKLPNGESKYFEPHIKMGNFRIHFYPDNKNHVIYVGYIGPHLPT